jgi:hypothetical protein
LARCSILKYCERRTSSITHINPPPMLTQGSQISYVQSILTAVKANLNIDSNRIYATGFSNGGGFVNLLACTSATSGLFAAYATSSAALYAGTRSMSGCDTGGRPIALVDFRKSNRVIPILMRDQADLDVLLYLRRPERRPNPLRRSQRLRRRHRLRPPQHQHLAPRMGPACRMHCRPLGEHGTLCCYDKLPRPERDIIQMGLPACDDHRVYRADHGALLAHEGRRILGRDAKQYRGVLQYQVSWEGDLRWREVRGPGCFECPSP